MARLIKHCAKGPVEVKPEEGSKWICQCGLSQNKPYCDSSHTQTITEDDLKLYIYKDGKQTEIPDDYHLDCLYPK